MGLPEAAIAHYRAHGYYAPVRVMPPAEAETIRRQLEAHEAVHGALKGSMRHKSHLLFTWLDGLIRHPAVLDAVEGVIDRHSLLDQQLLHQGADEVRFVSWHQDATYWGLDPDDVVTAWIALSDAPVESGAMKLHCPAAQRASRSPTPIRSRGIIS